MEVVEGVTLSIALLGAVLGIINTWQNVNAHRLRLRVSPKWAISAHGEHFAIEVTNQSTFAITVLDVGMLFSRPFSKTPKRLVITTFLSAQSLPLRLEAREQRSFYFDPAILPRGTSLWGAYARTACGELAWGKSAALRQLTSK